ncbi:MAG: hypothetical protein IKE91_01020 [Clostridia bacterium]|nr:hypothetical protein [Clostridia bacterium]
MRKILLSTIFAIAILGVMACFSKVEASTSWTSSTSSIPISRTITGVTNNVNGVTFGYTVTADSNNPAGGVSGSIPAPSVTFNNVTPSSGTATATSSVDLSGLSFSSVGTYKYRITETSTNNNAYPVDSSDYFDIVISVENELDNNNQPTGNFVATVLGQAIDKNNQKNDILFTSAADLECIQVTKNVTGATADPNKYFQYTINIAAAGTYAVSGGSHSSNPSTVTGNQSTTFYLKSGETITFGQSSGTNQILPGTTYTVTEDGNSSSGYTVYYTQGSSGTETSGSSVTTTVSTTDADNHVTFRNNKGSESVTGILLDIAPYICLVVLAIVGIVIIKKNTVK